MTIGSLTEDACFEVNRGRGHVALSVDIDLFEICLHFARTPQSSIALIAGFAVNSSTASFLHGQSTLVDHSRKIAPDRPFADSRDLGRYLRRRHLYRFRTPLPSSSERPICVKKFATMGFLGVGSRFSGVTGPA